MKLRCLLFGHKWHRTEFKCTRCGCAELRYLSEWWDEVSNNG